MSKNISKILILRFSSIGDIVLCSPVVRNLKQQLECEVHIVTKDKFRGLLSHSPYVDKLWTFKKKVDEVLGDLKKEGFDLIIDLHKNLRSQRVRKALAVKAISFNKINLEKWLIVHLKINRLPEKHLIDRYMESMSSILSIVDDGKGMDFFYDPSFKKGNATLGLTQNYITIVLGATYFTKRVPEHLIQSILSDYQDRQVVFIGGGDVQELGAALTTLHDNILDLTGKLSLQQSAAVLDGSTVIITGDTGMMHIAAALQKPIISIWGSTFLGFGIYPYYGKNNENLNISIEVKDLKCRPCSKIGKDHCPKSHFDCMMKIDYSRLKNAIDRQLMLS